ncbi:MAG TPA: orotidine-5'-phosphate decarboxylase [Candidatus Binatia bacterium]|nr:orotidine-5'-phosphate decarboxylase [Candidatus Binatia bacterium]
MQAKDKIIYALDVDSLDKAKARVAAISPHVGPIKIGLELITAVGGPQAVDAVHDAGGLVMYDGKFNDIPNTMAGATRPVAARGVKMFTVHASSGLASVKAAVAACGASKVIGVTVLTSIDEEECVEIFGDRPSAKVRAFAELLCEAGAHVVVCSPQEVGGLADLPLLRITPGVRPLWAAAGDQKRVMTPGEAIRAGADYLVIGRPISAPPPEVGSPAEAAGLIAREIEEALG